MAERVIVVGYDSWTDAVLESLQTRGIEYTVVLRDRETAGKLESEGHAVTYVPEFNEAAFQEAGSDQANAILVATLNDQLNVLAVLTAADISEKTTIATFVGDRRDASKFRRAGADTVVKLGEVIGQLIAETALTGTDPDQLLDTFLAEDRAVEHAEEIRVEESESEDDPSTIEQP